MFHPFLPSGELAENIPCSEKISFLLSPMPCGARVAAFEVDILESGKQERGVHEGIAGVVAVGRSSLQKCRPKSQTLKQI
jgi:hypothetical protein